MTVGEEGEGVCGGGGDEEKIRSIGEFDVSGFPGMFFVLKGDKDRIPGESLESEGCDELTSGFCHDRMHVVLSFDELRCEISGFVSSDGSSDAKDNFHKTLNFKF